MKSSASNRGLSLVELLLVITVLGTIAMLAAPDMISTMEDTRLSAAAGEVASAIEYAQLKAVNTGLPARVEIMVSTDSLSLEQFELPHEIEEEVPAIDQAVVEGGTFETMDHPFNPGVPYSLNLGGNGLFGGIDLTGAAFGAGTTLTFDGLGAPSDGGTVTLACGHHQRTIHVDGLTGKVTVN